MKHAAKIASRIAAAVGLLIAQCVLGQQEFQPAQSSKGSARVSKTPIPPGGREMRFRVVDADTGSPIAGVTVRAWVRANLVTDDSGSCFFALPAPRIVEGASPADFYYRINFSKDGYVPRFVTWSRAQNDRIADIPAQYTAKLEAAVSIGGFVRNQAGEPIAGARVIFSGVNPAAPGQREKTTVAPSYHVERTDDNGHWHCNHAPRDFQNMTFRVTHPDFLPTTFGCSGAQAGGLAAAALPREDFLAGAAVMVMGHGIELAGLVVDRDGKAVSGASITRNHEWRNAAALLETGADGRFKIPNLRPGLMMLTFQAKGLEPQTLLVTNKEQMPELKLVMGPGKILKGRITGQSGNPIPGATIQMDRLGLKPLELDWNTMTDADGRFLWDSAPAGAHPYFISANGYNSRSEPALAADGEDKVIVLRESQDGRIFVDGKVLDATTKAPVEKFTVITREFKGDAPEAHTQREVLAKNGEYSATLSQDSAAYLIEIRADGRLPQVSDRKSPGDGDRRIDFELEKGAVLAGKVILPDGKPASGAEVAVCSQNAGAVLGARRLVEQFRTNVTVTGPDGTFAFPATDDAQTIYAVHEEGFGQLDLEGAKPPFEITLRPWGKIEGTARAAGAPLVNENISLLQPFEYMGLSFSYYDFLAKTDERGGFVLSNVPPIEVRVSRMVNNAPQSPQFAVIEPGRTAKLDYRATGRLLVGKLVVAGYNSHINWQAGQQVRLLAKVSEPAHPEFEDAAAQKKWSEHFWKSPEGKAFIRAQRSFTAKLDAEGGFVIEDVAPGDYQLVAQVRQTPQEGGQRIASLTKDITVAESPAGGGAAAVDLGTIEMSAAKNLQLGDAAPLFAIKTIDGQPLKLADFRGKYVLLDFWATWCAPCRGETPHLKATYDAYGKDPRFAMIGLSLDAMAASPKQYARENEIHWIQGFLGEWLKAAVPDLYGVDGIPSIFLIDPDGKIAARDLRGDAIGRAVGKALGAN